MKVKPSSHSRKILVEVGPIDWKLLRGAEREERPFSISRILVPVDFSDSSRKPLLYATRFAAAFNATLQVVHVLEIPYGAGEAGLVLADPGTTKSLEQSSWRRAKDLIRKTGGADVKADVIIKTGVPYHEIIETAREERTDLIILSTHGRTGLKRVFMGSTAERVVRHAPCPVLVVRDQEVDFIAEHPMESSRG